MCGVFILLTGTHPKAHRDPGDALWMERMRRNTMELVQPLRDRLVVSIPQFGVIRIGGNSEDEPVAVVMDESDRPVALEILIIAKESVLGTSEWIDGEPYTAPDSDGRSQKLFNIKDRLWESTIQYLDMLWLIFSDEDEVPSSALVELESHISALNRALDDEFLFLGLGDVE
jgi:hypothetical protein